MSKNKENNSSECFNTSKYSRDNIWLFNTSDQFAGNVKYLFLYIYHKHKEIFSCYVSENESIVEYVKSIGYPACILKSEEAKALMNSAGVYVTEHCKEYIPEELQSAKILNLFHGIGLKEIERQWNRDFLGLKIAKKYIRYNEIYRRFMCFLATSEFMEAHFKRQIDLDDSQIIRAGYPRCTQYSLENEIRTYNDEKVLGTAIKDGKRIALYAPTYREHDQKNFLHKAIKDIYALINELKNANYILIIKLHPKATNDFYFRDIEEISKTNNNIILWDNTYDIYEIFPKIDLAIIDYSSIYYDLLISGVKHFIRYIFDYAEESKYLIYDYFENTTGKICRDFEELLESISKSDFDDNEEASKKVIQKFWSFSTKDNNERIIKQAREFQPRLALSMPNLYSFDIFDTLISRKVLKPSGIFFYVMDRIMKADCGFPEIFCYDYPKVRMDAEADVREYTKKCIGNIEISFDSIFRRISDTYNLSDDQIMQLKQWEIEAELDNVVPVYSNIERIERLIDDGATVVLISDMYLDKSVIIKLLEKASKKIANLPIFLSSDIGVQKTTQKLYLTVYRSFNSYIYKEWHHFGDNNFADLTCAQSVGITPHIHEAPQFNEFEQGFVDRYRCYDSFLVSAFLARIRFYHNLGDKEYYALAHLGFCFIPYIIWSVRNAISRGIKTLYFISRDGYFLKLIADEYIKLENINLKTKYIYGSRRAWRLPAMVDKIDEDFFSNYGNFVGVDNFNKLLESLDISDHKFQTLFPDLHIDKNDTISKKDLDSIKSYLNSSERFTTFILQKAKEKRKLVLEYLKQEIDFSEQFAFVEFWGRGYTQTLFGRLLDLASGGTPQNIFYYYRSILPTEGRNVRVNYTTNKSSLIFCEAIFANHPFYTVHGYKRQGDTIVQIMDRQSFDTKLFYAMETYLPTFLQEFLKCNFIKRNETIERFCSDYSLHWFAEHQDDPCIVNSIAHLEDSVELWGDVREFAPQFTDSPLSLIKNGRPISSLTKSLTMSLARSTEEVRNEFYEIQENKKASGENLFYKEDKLLLKLHKNPQRFFRDSKNPFLRLASKICFTRFTKAFLGDPLTSFATRQLLLRKSIKALSENASDNQETKAMQASNTQRSGNVTIK